MELHNPKDPSFHFWLNNLNRRRFMSRMGMATAGVFLSRYAFANDLVKLPAIIKPESSNMVAVTQGENYESSFIRARVEHLFNSLGGISDVVHPGDKVGIKINLTGGSGWANHANLDGVDIRECVWTHPEVLRAVGELLIDSGVSPGDIYIVEALWDDPCYYDYGYSDVQQYLGAQVVNLNVPAPYPAFVTRSTGNDYFFYPSFIQNQILEDIDVFVSIPKMKQHATAGVTHSMKNLVGITPLEFYQRASQPGDRSWLHSENGEDAAYHLPRSIVDLNLSRPIHLAVIDGIKNAIGGEGPWNPTFEPHEDHYLLAGKNSVSTDSVCSYIMGNNPESQQFLRPDGTYCDNYLMLAAQKGLGTNIMSGIQLVGDGAGTVGINEPGENPAAAGKARLDQNYPNPFRSSTSIRYNLKEGGQVSLTVYDENGREIKRIVKGFVPAGDHVDEFYPNGLSAGNYLLKLEGNGFSEVKKMMVTR
jgi:uncharacterized protein (DUF362 family)